MLPDCRIVTHEPMDQILAKASVTILINDSS
jgi:hypothetical protein